MAQQNPWAVVSEKPAPQETNPQPAQQMAGDPWQVVSEAPAPAAQTQEQPGLLDRANQALASNPADPTLTKIGKSLGRTALMVPNMAVAATAPTKTPEEEALYNSALPGLGQPTLAAHRLVWKPMEDSWAHTDALAQKQREAIEQNRRAGKITNEQALKLLKKSQAYELAGKTLSEVPMLGPLATTEGEQAAKGDVAGTVTDTLGMAALPEVTKGLTPKILSEATEAVTRPLTDTVGKTFSKEVPVASPPVNLTYGPEGPLPKEGVTVDPLSRSVDKPTVGTGAAEPTTPRGYGFEVEVSPEGEVSARDAATKSADQVIGEATQDIKAPAGRTKGGQAVRYVADVLLPDTFNPFIDSDAVRNAEIINGSRKIANALNQTDNLSALSTGQKIQDTVDNTIKGFNEKYNDGLQGIVDRSHEHGQPELSEPIFTETDLQMLRDKGHFTDEQINSMSPAEIEQILEQKSVLEKAESLYNKGLWKNMKDANIEVFGGGWKMIKNALGWGWERLPESNAKTAFGNAVDVIRNPYRLETEPVMVPTERMKAVLGGDHTEYMKALQARGAAGQLRLSRTVINRITKDLGSAFTKASGTGLGVEAVVHPAIGVPMAVVGYFLQAIHQAYVSGKPIGLSHAIEILKALDDEVASSKATVEGAQTARIRNVWRSSINEALKKYDGEYGVSPEEPSLSEGFDATTKKYDNLEMSTKTSFVKDLAQKEPGAVGAYLYYALTDPKNIEVLKNLSKDPASARLMNDVRASFITTLFSELAAKHGGVIDAKALRTKWGATDPYGRIFKDFPNPEAARLAAEQAHMGYPRESLEALFGKAHLELLDRFIEKATRAELQGPMTVPGEIQDGLNTINKTVQVGKGLAGPALAVGVGHATALPAVLAAQATTYLLARSMVSRVALKGMTKMVGTPGGWQKIANYLSKTQNIYQYPFHHPNAPVGGVPRPFPLYRQPQQEKQDQQPGQPTSDNKPPFSFKQYLTNNMNQHPNTESLQQAAMAAANEAMQSGHEVIE